MRSRVEWEVEVINHVDALLHLQAYGGTACGLNQPRHSLNASLVVEMVKDANSLYETAQI